MLDAADGEEVVLGELQVFDFVADGALDLDRLKGDARRGVLPKRLVILVAGHFLHKLVELFTYVLVDDALQRAGVDGDAVLVNVADDAVEDFVILRLEGNDGEPHVEDDIASRVLDDSFEIAPVKVQLVPDDVDDEAVLFGALANVLLVDLLLDFVHEVLAEIGGFDRDYLSDVFNYDEHF